MFFTTGTDPSAWSPVGSSPTNIQFSEMTAPLEPLRDNLILVEKLSSNGTSDNHAAPGGLTGLGYSSNRHISVDQFIADGLRAQGVQTPIPSLILGGVSTEQQTSFFRDGQRLSPIFSPTAAYETIFADAAPGGNSAELIRRRQSALDVIGGELAQLKGKLGTQERQRLELHARSIRQVEQRLVGGGGGACGSPPAPGPGGQQLLDSAAHLDLALTAFSCDITRVAAVQFGHHQSTQVSLPDVGAPGDWHNSFIHGDNPRTRLIKLERWLSTQFVNAVQRSKTLPAPDGNGTLFDQTLFVWARDMGDAIVHNANDMRFAFAGGAGGYLDSSPNGRYLDGGGDAHQRALLSCIEAMGITDFSGFGDEALGGTGRQPLALQR